jgi:hypothetical protein
MDIAALIVDPFPRGAASELLPALHATAIDPAAPLDVIRTRVAFSMHGVLGRRLIVHLDDLRDGTHDPYRFFADMPGDFGAAGFGPGLSGYLADAMGDGSETATVYTCTYERRAGGWSVFEGAYYTAEGEDVAEDDGPFQRLCERLAVADRDLLRRKLEMPDTDWCLLTEPLPRDIADQLQALEER